MNELSKRIEGILKTNKLTIRGLQNITGVDHNTIKRWVEGTQVPRKETLDRFYERINGVPPTTIQKKPKKIYLKDKNTITITEIDVEAVDWSREKRQGLYDRSIIQVVNLRIGEKALRIEPIKQNSLYYICKEAQKRQKGNYLLRKIFHRIEGSAFGVGYIRKDVK